MDAIKLVVLIFSLAGAVDWLAGNRFGIGQEFQKAFSLFGAMALSMLGMIVVAPAIGAWLEPAFFWFYNTLGLDPSIIPASVFANDMGGASLALSVCRSEALGGFNGLVISSMMGCVISFTIPFALGVVEKGQHKQMFFGFLCGIATVPVGGFVSGLLCGISPVTLLLDLLPLVILAVILCAGLLWIPGLCIRCFTVFGVFMKALALVGLGCAVFTFLTGVEIDPRMQTLEQAAFVCVNACVTLSGALPFMAIVSRILRKPLNKIGNRLGINGVSALALLGSLVTNASTFGMMEKMDKKGVVLNSAFAVSAAFAFGSHLAYTMALDTSYLTPMIVGKLISGIAALLLALALYKDKE